MVWRAGYQTKAIESGQLPLLIGVTVDGDPAELTGSGVLLGGFDFHVQAEQGIWRRLIEDAFPQTVPIRAAFIRPGWTHLERQKLQMLIPRSLHAQVFCLDDPEGEWAARFPADRVERGFAVVFSEGEACFGMIGPPTEEAWDAFREAILEYVSTA